MLLYPITDQYASGAPDDPNVSPLRLKKAPAFPPTLLATAEYDVLRDEGIAYADKLKAAGIPVAHLHSPDMGHTFPVTPNLVARFPECDETLFEGSMIGKGSVLIRWVW